MEILEEEYGDKIYRPGEEVEITMEIPDDLQRAARLKEIEEAFDTHEH